MSAGKHKLFVYGTLRPGPATHKLPGYMMFSVRGKNFDFPVIQAYPWQDFPPHIMGNILEVDDEKLAELDKYENVESGLYIRKHALAYNAYKTVAEPIPVQVYVGGPALLHKPIPNGLWEPKET